MEGISVPVWSFGAYFSSSPLFSHLLSLLFLHWVPVWLYAGAPGPVLRQTRLIEREGCSLLISSDSSVLPEVGVPPHAEFSQQNNSAVVKKHRPCHNYPGNLPGEPDEFCGHKKEGKPTFSALRLQGGELCQHLVEI